MLAADDPNITDWMQGWGSLLSVLMSTVAVIFTGWLLRHEIRVRREEKADADAAQARLVVGKITNWHGAMRDEQANLYGPIHDLEWEIKNYSGAPVFDATIMITNDRQAASWSAELFGTVIEDEARGIISSEPPIVLDQGQLFDPRQLQVQITFTDAAGLIWIRSLGEPPERIIFKPARYSGIQRWLPFLRKNVRNDSPPF